MKKIMFTLAVLTGSVAFPSLSFAQIAEGTKSSNVTHITAGTVTLKQQPSAYNQAKTWKLFRAGKTSILKETNRDDWSVYLMDNAGANYTADLWTKRLVMPQITSLRLPLPTAHVTIDLTAADAIVDGYNVGCANFTSGSLRFASNSQWIDGLGNSYQESGRDDWSVYLTNLSGSASIKVDLHTKTVTPSNSASRALLSTAVVANNFLDDCSL